VAGFADQKSKALAVVLFCAIAMVCLGTLYFVGNLARFQDVNDVRETRAALRDLKDAAQLEQLLKQYPSDRTLKLVALANRDSVEIDAAAQGVLGEVDPGELSMRINKGLSSRSDLKALGRDVKAAEDNAAGLPSRYDALIKPVRDSIEHGAGVLEGRTNTLAKFMAMIDAQQAAMKALIAKISAARLDYFRAYEKCIALLANENGVSKTGNGPIIFRLQADADSYNQAAAATAAIAKRLADLETERAAQKQSQLDRWKSWASG
jgi:hypothetical protein